MLKSDTIKINMSRESITLRDVYEAVNRVEDKMDRRFTPLESRVDNLEDFKGRALGVLGVISFIGSAIFSWAWNKITKTA